MHIYVYICTYVICVFYVYIHTYIYIYAHVIRAIFVGNHVALGISYAKQSESSIGPPHTSQSIIKDILAVPIWRPTTSGAPQGREVVNLDTITRQLSSRTVTTAIFIRVNCWYVCNSLYIYIHTHVFTNKPGVFLHIYVAVCICICIHICMYLRVGIHVYMYTHTHICICLYSTYICFSKEQSSPKTRGGRPRNHTQHGATMQLGLARVARCIHGARYCQLRSIF